MDILAFLLAATMISAAVVFAGMAVLLAIEIFS